MDAALRQPGSRPGFAARLGSFAGWTCLLVLAAAALVVIGGTLAMRHLDEEIRQHVEQRFRLHYAPQGLTVHIGSAHRVEGKGIELRDIRLIHPGRPAADAEVAHIGEGFVTCRTDLADLITGNLQVGHVTVRRLKIHTTRDPDGTWNAKRLFPVPRFGNCPPQGVVEQATVEIVDGMGSGRSQLTLRDVEVQFAPDACDVKPTGTPRTAALRIKGTCTGDHFDRIRVDAFVDPQQGWWSAQGSAEGVQISPALRASLPHDIAAKLAPLAALRGRLKLNCQASSSFPSDEPPQFTVTGELTDGQIDDPRLPDPLSNIRADIHCDAQGLRIERMTARSGLGIIGLTCHREGFAENSPLVLKAKIRQLELDSHLAKVLPRSLRAEWDKLSPTGMVNADLTLSFDGRQWQPDLKIDCTDVSLAYYKFPYRIHGALGTIVLKDNKLTVRLKALAAGQVVRLNGDFLNPGPDYTGALVVMVDGPIPLDETLLAALDENAQQVIRALRPRGSVSCQARFDRRLKGKQYVLRQHAEFTLHDCAIKYDKFPYPLENIRGTISVTDGRWEFKELVGHNDSAHVTCEGSWATAPGGGLLRLDFVGTDVPLSDELQHALSPQGQRVWSQLGPRGTLDYLKISLAYEFAKRQFDLAVQAQKWKRQQNLEGRTISIEPSWFPYRLDNVTGAAEYKDGVVTFKNVSATHAATGISLAGRCEFAPGGPWRVLLERATADRVRVDHDLLAALPSEARSHVVRLNPTGPISLQGTLEMKGDAGEEGPPSVAWDAVVDVENGGVQCGVNLEHLHGGLRVIGKHDGRQLQARGELGVDSVVCSGVQFTNITGPFWIDGSHLLLGSRAEAGQRRAAPRQISARLYGGTLSGDAQIALGGDAQFDLQATLSDADLAVASQDLARGKRQVAGKVFANLHLAGDKSGTHTWRGGGTARLREADIYEVPVMLAMLKLLSVRRPSTTAFNDGDIDFRIQGDRFYFDRLDFKGDAVTLKGSGEMDLEKHLNLQFYTLVGRDEVRVPVITPMLGLASQQLLLIEVTGSVDKPELTKKAFPGLNDTLKQLFPELQETKTWTGHSLVSPREALQRSGLAPRR